MTDQAGARKPTNLPWIRTVEEDLIVDSFGGIVSEYTNKTGGTLLIGDQVFLASDFGVDKSTTQADYDTATGVVMGGEQIDMYEVAPYSPGIIAALDGELVMVAWAGKVPVALEGAAAAGSIVGASAATAGAVVTPAVSGRTAIVAGPAPTGFVTILLPYL